MLASMTSRKLWNVCVSAVTGGLLAAAIACAAHKPRTLEALCAGGRVVANLDATVDSIRAPAGPALQTLRGRHFAVRLTFVGQADSDGGPTASAAGCSGHSGLAEFAGDFPPGVGTATSGSHQATWRIEGEMVLLDLNPGTRDNNVFVALPLAGGRGHWGLSTFAGEVASGAADVR